MFCVKDPQQSSDQRNAASSPELLSNEGYDKYIPSIIVFGSFILFAAVGFTMSFVPLYLIKEFGTSLSANALIMGAEPLAAAAFVWPSSALGKKIGSPSTVILSQLVGAGSLIIISKSHNFWVSAASLLMRTATIFVPISLNSSLLNTYVPKFARGKWNALHNMALFSSFLSAVAGGYLSDARGYRTTFKASAVIMFAGMCVYAPLVWMVKKPVFHGEAPVKLSYTSDGYLSDDTMTPPSADRFSESTLSPLTTQNSTRL